MYSQSWTNEQPDKRTQNTRTRLTYTQKPAKPVSKPRGNVKNLILQKHILTSDELIITAFPQQLYRRPGQSILTLHSFFTDWYFDDRVRQNRQAHYAPHRAHRAACYSLTHLGRDCVAGAKESPPQWDLSWEVKSSSGNINSSTSVKGTCWFNTFLSTGE